MHYSKTNHNKKLFNIGILGLASIASRKVIPTLLNLPDKFNLVAIASKSKSNLDNSIKSKCKFYDDYYELLDKENLDVIYIPLPNSLHYYWSKECLNRGINVLVEKPSTCSLKETEELITIAKCKKLSIVETFQFRFHKQFDFIKKIINEKKIGELRSINSSFGFPKTNFPENIRYQKKYGGGSLLDAGVYPTKIVSLLSGLGMKVKSSSLIKDPELNIDMWGAAHFEDINAKLNSQISFGFDNNYKCDLEIWGSKGKIKTNRIFTPPSDLVTKLELEINGSSETIVIGKDDHFKNLMLYFYETLSNKKLLIEESMYMVEQARLIEEIREKSLE